MELPCSVSETARFLERTIPDAALYRCPNCDHWFGVANFIDVFEEYIMEGYEQTNKRCSCTLSKAQIYKITRLYSELDDISHFSSTAIAKTMHILKPDLFVMWDNEILKHYWKIELR